ncbi:hypothetical protein ACIRL2_42240 [Embleya sp. NPDC127516]|uniref:hypothetical protein n=1 Tax=Embleya sp. NPDC127516 TaxID=3363990 RepID=UPI003822AF56
MVSPTFSQQMGFFPQVFEEDRLQLRVQVSLDLFDEEERQFRYPPRRCLRALAFVPARVWEGW